MRCLDSLRSCQLAISSPQSDRRNRCLWVDPLGLAMSKIKNVFSLLMNENKNEKKTVKQKSGPSENKTPLAARPIPPSLLLFVVIPWVHHFYFILAMLLRIVITVNCLQPQATWATWPAMAFSLPSVSQQISHYFALQSRFPSAPFSVLMLFT